MKTFAEVLRNFQRKKRHIPSCRYARIVAEIAKGNVQAEQIAQATGESLKNVQNRLGELRESGVLQVKSLAMPLDRTGRSLIEWRIAA